MNLAEKLVSLRKQKGLTQMALAERLNVSRQAVSRWEIGTTVPGTDNLKILGELYGVPIDYLLDDDAEDGSVSVAEADSPNAAMPEVRPLVPEHPLNRIKYPGLVVCVLAVICSATVLILAAMLLAQDREPIIPMEDMSTSIEDDYPEGTFIIE